MLRPPERRTSLGFAYAAEGQIPESRQRPDGETGALEEGAAIGANAGVCLLGGSGTSANSMTFRPLDQQRRPPYGRG